MTENGSRTDFKDLEKRIKRDGDYIHLDRISRDFTEEVLHALDAAVKQQKELQDVKNDLDAVTVFIAEGMERNVLGTEKSMPSAEGTRVAHPRFDPGVSYPEAQGPGQTWNINAGDYINLPSDHSGVVAKLIDRHEGIRVLQGKYVREEKDNSYEEDVTVLQIVDGERIQTRILRTESTDTIDASVVIFDNTHIDPLKENHQRERYVTITPNDSIPPSFNISLRTKVASGKDTSWPIS